MFTIYERLKLEQHKKLKVKEEKLIYQINAAKEARRHINIRYSNQIK